MLTPTGVLGSLGSGMVVAAAYTLLPLYLQRIGMSVNQVRPDDGAGVGSYAAAVSDWALVIRHDRQMVFIGISGFCVLVSAAILWLPLSTPLLAVLLFLLGGGVFAFYPVAVSHAADQHPPGRLYV